MNDSDLKNINYLDNANKIIYEKELQIVYFIKNPDNTYNEFLDFLTECIKKGYRIKDRKSDCPYSKEIEIMLYRKNFPWRNETSLNKYIYDLFHKENISNDSENNNLNESEKRIEEFERLLNEKNG